MNNIKDCETDSQIKIIPVIHPDKQTDITGWSLGEAENAVSFHRSFPEYSETPLVSLKNTARLLGVSDIYIKDESYRFGLNAFKVLGGSYAAGKHIAEMFERNISDVDYNFITAPAVHEKLKNTTVITATDGNHGRGVAWTAHRLGIKCIVYMPAGTADERLENILKLGAEASVTDMSYDDCVRRAAAEAEENGWLLMQDTAWEGYEKIPLWIMQGYMTMAYEAAAQLERCASGMPTHIVLQAGVGSMAAAVTAFFRNYCSEKSVTQPVIIIIEPESADCFFRTASADDGKLHSAENMHTIMAGLACGEPCTAAWDIIHSYGDFCAVMPDSATALGMRMLSAPEGGDSRIISGESGAAGFGLIAAIMSDDTYAAEREAVGLGPDSRILCISTEGATDIENYRKIVWHGNYAD